MEASGDTVTVTATVTNAGSVEGKDVVEVYYSAPYTKGGIEKPAVVLAGFAKTSALAAGASETIKIEFPVRQMASWSSEKGAYVLDGGDYVISLRTDSHTVVDQKTVSVTEKTFDTDEVTGTKLQNQFADLTEYMEKNCKGEMLSRSDFKGTFPKPAEDKDSADCGITIAEYNWKDHEDSAATMPTTGASNGLSLIDMRGKDYDDEAWDTLLDQLSVDEMTGMLNDCAYNTGAVESISKPETSEPDGPAGFTSLTGPTGNCAYCSEFIMAQTWNVELMERMGEMVVQLYARTSKTVFSAVRFGNVLGSNGSVIPVFQRQIAAGGPLTVTHPDIERFFMTIPEASRLVIQAGGMAHGGEIFILDMGEPVKIVELAKGLIQLQGLTPDVDVKIVFTGLREGEKMYEELLMDEESTLPTDNHSILISTGQEISTKPFYSRSWIHVLRYQGSESSADTASTASAQTYAKGTYKVTAGSLNIRSQASNTSEVVGTVTRGYTVTVTSTSGRWGRFLYNGTPAWISLKYCEPAASAPTEVTVPTTRFTGKSSTKKKVTVRWSRVSGISGYRIAYKKKGAAKYTIKNLSAKKTSLTISAQSRKNYVFRIRTYVKVNGKKYSSPYVHAYTVKAK